ncbi:ABC transporter ATP-binding protein [Halobacillus yeomjeoni]|uniref:ABC transporter ATP-binding protein n=1 Tax=Halobacillus yeomjeoni TaxID=311194 RepID=A0A931MU72_9BACI|nr:ABC transporter ATP-binding protein [Halobacillus yeomjeoni]MBH0229200.1 ABC transporter ATP-binding protein [Halobacillus yeomjeoni]
MENMVKVNQVSFQYQTKSQILEDINFSIEDQSFVSILGPSGCGKSTMLNLIAGFIQATEGTIEIEGEIVRKPSDTRGFVFQDLALFPWLNVFKNVEFGLKMKGMPKYERTEKVEKMIRLVGLSEYSQAPISSLSGGMKQRVALARTLVTEPSILLLDEPFSALDAQTRDQLQEELISLHQNLKMTTALVTHSIDEAIYLSDRIILLSKEGRVKEVIDIDLDRPRERTDERFHEYQNRLYKFLQNERQLQ